VATPRTVTRDVRSADPSLSPEANRLLTEELRRAVGRADPRPTSMNPAAEARAGAQPQPLSFPMRLN